MSTSRSGRHSDGAGGRDRNEDQQRQSAVEPELVAAAEAYSKTLDQSLATFCMVFEKMTGALLGYADQIAKGELKDSEVSSGMKQVLPLLSFSMNQESKLYEQIEQRAGKAGKYAFDLGQARSEIGSRLVSLRKAREREGISGQPE